MKKGQRKYYITIQSYTRTPDGQGGATPLWANADNDWAKIVTQSQSRALEQGGIKFNKAVEFIVRSRTDFVISTDMRIVFDSEYFAIHSIIPSNKLDELKIIAYTATNGITVDSTEITVDSTEITVDG